MCVDLIDVCYVFIFLYLPHHQLYHNNYYCLFVSSTSGDRVSHIHVQYNVYEIKNRQLQYSCVLINNDCNSPPVIIKMNCTVVASNVEKGFSMENRTHDYIALTKRSTIRAIIII